MGCGCNKGRVSGTRFHQKGYDGIVESIGRGVVAFTGFALGEVTTNVLLKDQKAKNQGIIGAGKVVASHLLAPMILPDNIIGNNFVQSGLDGFGVSGIKDVLLANAKSFADKLGISGDIDMGYPGYIAPNRQTNAGTDGGGNAVKADLK